MADLFSNDTFNNINMNDSVIIVGKDNCKGLIGIVVGINKSISLQEPIFTIELQASGEKVQRRQQKLKRFFIGIN